MPPKLAGLWWVCLDHKCIHRAESFQRHDKGACQRERSNHYEVSLLRSRAFPCRCSSVAPTSRDTFKSCVSMPTPRKWEIVPVPQLPSKAGRSLPDFHDNPCSPLYYLRPLNPIVSPTNTLAPECPDPNSNNTFTIKLVLEIYIHIDNYKLPILVASIL